MRPFRTSFDIFIEISPKVKKLGLYEPLCYATFGPSHVQLAIFFKLMAEKVSIACIGNFLSPLKQSYSYHASFASTNTHSIVYLCFAYIGFRSKNDADDLHLPRYACQKCRATTKSAFRGDPSGKSRGPTAGGKQVPEVEIDVQYVKAKKTVDKLERKFVYSS